MALEGRNIQSQIYVQKRNHQQETCGINCMLTCVTHPSYEFITHVSMHKACLPDSQETLTRNKVDARDSEQEH